MGSGQHKLTPRDPRALSWKTGPLPTDVEPGTSVVVFRPFFSVPCAANVLTLLADSAYPGGPIVWGSLDDRIESEAFEDELNEEDFWAILGPDASFVFRS